MNEKTEEKKEPTEKTEKITQKTAELIRTALKDFESDCFARLDELDERLNSFLETNTTASSGHISPRSSASSFDKNNINIALQEISSDHLNQDCFSFNESIAHIISDARESLFNKATTKKLIEKANLKYVDSSFQRFSAEITAQMTQKVSQKHQQLEEEIDQIDRELTELKEKAIKEFAELRSSIKEIQELHELQIQAELAKNARFGGRKIARKIHSKTLLKKDNVRLLRPKSVAAKDTIGDLTLHPHK